MMLVKSRGHTTTDRREAMTEGSEVRATHEEVEAFVDKLKGFHSSLESAQGGETAGYRRAKKRYGDPD